MTGEQKTIVFALFVWLAVVLLLAVACGNSSGDDYTVTRGTVIESQRPIWLLVLEAGLGVLNDEPSLAGMGRSIVADETTLRIDGRPAPGIGGMVSAAWRLVGFVVWDEAGRIERRTRATVRGHSVTIDDRVENGRVWGRVTVGPPLGDPRVRYAMLEVAADETDQGQISIRRALTDYAGGSGAAWTGHTRIRLVCSASIDLPADCRRAFAHARLQRAGRDRALLSERVSEREAGPELESRVGGIAEAGIAAVRDGRSEVSAAVRDFLERVCR